MMLAALLDLGFSLAELKKLVKQLRLPIEVEVRATKKAGIRAKKVVFKPLQPQPNHRSCRELLEILAAGELAPEISQKVKDSILRLAQAEAAVHGEDPQDVHFHELGGLDTLVDLAGVFTGVRALGIKKIHCSPLPLGRGVVKCAHGILPLPAPATLELLKQVPTYGVPLEAELVTPTGALLATSLANCFGPPPPALWKKFGHGAGSLELPQPNILRAWLGESASEEEQEYLPFESDQVIILETQVDDHNPEFLSYLRGQLETEGALDVTFIPAMMKKGRPGTLISILSPQEKLLTLCKLIFQHTTALGVRWFPVQRYKLSRSFVEVDTPYGKVTVKLGFSKQLDGTKKLENIAPEFESCASVAREKGISIKEVYQAAISAAYYKFSHNFSSSMK
ncbi:MAG: hypothetical protein XD63_0408 [Thermoanaerobacterales bacterium 50_218]|nr:MAG: hypothetical protein XD63_0408 [Thermoanaerobacterales bacterium 50_218]